MKKIVKKAVKRKKQQPKIVRYYFEDVPQSYSHGGNVKNEYNQLVGRSGDEYYFLNYIFHHSDGFKGATGDVIMPVSKSYYDYAMSREGIIERYIDSMGEDEWIDVIGIDREEYEDEDKLIEAIEDGIYDLFLAGQLHPFEEVNYDAESQMRKLPQFQDSDEFPIFEVVGGGRIFSDNIAFDDIYNQELYDKIKEVEGFKEGGELNKMVKIYYNSQIPFYKKDKNKYEIFENTPFVVVPKSKVNEVIHDHYVMGDWKNYLVPELMRTEDKIIHHRKGGEDYAKGGGVGDKFSLENYSDYDEFYNDVFDYIKSEEELTEEETKEICIKNESIIEAEFDSGSSPRFTGDVILGYLTNERAYKNYAKGGQAGLTSEEEEIIDDRIEYYFDNEDYTDNIDELVSFVIDNGEIDGEKYDLIKKYIKKNKYAKGGGVGKWVNYDKDHLINIETGMIVLSGTNLNNIKPKDVKGFEKLGMGKYAKGGGVGKKSKGGIGKSGTQYGYTLKEWEEMAINKGLLVSPKEWWKSQEGKTYTDSFGRKKKIGQHSQDERQSMEMYGYLIANGLDLGSEIIPTSAKKYVQENNYIKYAKGGGVGNVKRFDVDFYDSSDANRETSIELIIKQDSLDNAIQDAIKKAYELKKNYVEFYHRGFFLGSINFANSKEFKQGKYYDSYISNNLYADGGMIKVEDNVVITDNENENYSDYLDKNLIVVDYRKDRDGEELYDLEDEESGERLPYSFYRNEIELFAKGGGIMADGRIVLRDFNGIGGNKNKTYKLIKDDRDSDGEPYYTLIEEPSGNVMAQGESFEEVNGYANLMSGKFAKGGGVGDKYILENYSDYDEFYNDVFDYIKSEEELTEEETKEICITNESIIEAEFDSGSSPRFTGDVILGYLTNERAYKNYEKGGETGKKSKKTNKKKQPKMVRQYFEDRPYSYAGGGEAGDFTMKDGSKISRNEWYQKMEEKLGFEKFAERQLKDAQFGRKINAPFNELTHNRLDKKAVIGKNSVTISSYTPNYKRHLDSITLYSVKELDDYLNKNQILADGGSADLDYNEIFNVLKSKIDDAIDNIPNEYESASQFKGEEIEHESRSGFIPYTDGGYEAVWFETLGAMYSSGYNLPTKPLDDEMNRQIDYNLELARESFGSDYPEIVEELGEENIDYNSLVDAGYSDEAEELSNAEMDMMWEDTILMRILANYYNPENSRAKDGKHTIRLFGDVNLESPYHRTGNLDDSYEYEFTFDSIDELENEMAIGIAYIISWFEGGMYNDSTAEMKVRRMEEGGQAGRKSKKTTKKKQPKMVRQYFEDKPYSYAEGGEAGNDEKPYQVYNYDTQSVEGYFENEIEAEEFASKFKNATIYDIREYAEGGEVEDWMEEALESLIEETGNDNLEITYVHSKEFYCTDGDAEYRVFKTEEDAEETAIEQVREDLQEMPESFNQEWLTNFFEADSFFRAILEEYNYGYATDIMTEDDGLYANRLIREMVDWGIMTEEQAMKSDAEQIASDNIQDFVNLLTDDQCTNGAFEYYANEFGEEEAYNLAMSNNLIDFQEASENAVMLDGIGHFLSSYDGETIYLTSNSVAYRTN